MRKLVVLSLLFLFLLSGCKAAELLKEKREIKKTKSELILATTTSTMDTGLLDELLPVFERKYGIKVKPVAVGTGEALGMGRRGEADVLLVHAPEAEKEFMAAGYGKVRREVMYNDFIIVGPAADPAGIKGLSSASEAFKKIASKKATFVSRGDDSGTHKKELAIWRKAAIQPGDDWYSETGQGMGETLRVADQKQAYTLVDRGTYLASRDLSLILLVEGDSLLLNQYSVIAVNPKKFPQVKYTLAQKLIEFLISEEGQTLIGKFGRDRYGQSLFTPNAK
jgi:tungstate transport system substrate-binding protein